MFKKELETQATKIGEMTVEMIPYNKEKVEHLTEQLMILGKAYDRTPDNSFSSRAELADAMKSVNAALTSELGAKAIINIPADYKY